MSQEAPPVRKNARGSITEVFAEEARKLDGIEFLAQGTIWPDILESEEGIKHTTMQADFRKIWILSL